MLASCSPRLKKEQVELDLNKSRQNWVCCVCFIKLTNIKLTVEQLNTEWNFRKETSS